MGLSGQLVSQISINSNGKVFFEIFRDPHKISQVTAVEKVVLESGHWGTVGSVVSWHFTHDGKKMVSKDIFEVIDEEKKSITYSVIEGDIMEAYTNLKVIADVDDIDDTSCTVKHTIVYEKRSEAMPDPQSLMDGSNHLAKEIEHHLLLATK